MEDVLVPARSGQDGSGAPQPSRILTMGWVGEVGVGAGWAGARAIKRAVTPHLTARVTHV